MYPGPPLDSAGELVPLGGVGASAPVDILSFSLAADVAWMLFANSPFSPSPCAYPFVKATPASFVCLLFPHGACFGPSVAIFSELGSLLVGVRD